MVVKKMPDLVLTLFSLGGTPLITFLHPSTSASNMLYFASSLFTSYLSTLQFFYQASFSTAELMILYISTCMCSCLYSSCLKNPCITARFLPDVI